MLKDVVFVFITLENTIFVEFGLTAVLKKNLGTEFKTHVKILASRHP